MTSPSDCLTPVELLKFSFRHLAPVKIYLNALKFGETVTHRRHFIGPNYTLLESLNVPIVLTDLLCKTTQEKHRHQLKSCICL
jgi:hypothetical protein